MNSHSRSMPRWRRSAVLAGAVAALATSATPAQSGTDVLTTWIGLDAPTGREAGAMQIVQQALPGWTRDSLGNLIMRRGKGRPRRVVACAIDQNAFAVSEITDEGYLRLHGAGNWRRAALFDQWFEGQRIRLVTRGGWLPGVIAVRSTHLWRGRLPSDAPASVEDLWVDVGARSRAEVMAMGISILDGVVRDWPAWSFAGYVSGPSAGGRTGCAAVAAAAAGTPKKGETIFAITVQSGFEWAGLGAVVAAAGDVDSLIIAAPWAGRADTAHAPPADSAGAVFQRAAPAPFGPNGTRIGVTLVLSARTTFGGSLAEAVRESDADAYAAAIARAAGVAPAKGFPALAPRLPNDAMIKDSLTEAASIISALTRVYAVSGSEAPMRAAIMAMLPAWAKSAAKVDTAGNIVIAAGPERDTVAFVAHMDEIGFTVTAIAKDGTVSLSNRGGFFRSLWEGQPAVMHVAKGAPLPGVFLTRMAATTKQPTEMKAWFGLDSAALVARGTAVGTTITGVKSPSRLARSRFTARSIDDRAGCTALLLALGTLDPAKLTRKTYFVFSTREEIGLEGAAAFAVDHPRGIRRVYPVDTFVDKWRKLNATKPSWTTSSSWRYVSLMT